MTRYFFLLALSSLVLTAQTGSFPPAGAATGTVSSVAITAPSSFFSASGCTITTSGTCAFSYATAQTANRVFATDASGNVGSFALTTAMLPSIASTLLSDSASLVRTTDTGSVTSTMLAGAIANAKLSNSSVTFAGHAVSLGGSSAIACGDLSNAAASCATDATNASNLASGTLPAARLPNPSSSTLGGTQSIATASHQFVTGISTSGVGSKAQPAAADLSDGSTGTGNVVLANTPTLITPNLGAATATSLLASGIVDGQAPITVTTGSSATLGGTYKSGYTFNEHATAATAIIYTLPTAAAGLQYCVGNAYNGSAANTGTLEILTSASGQFIIFTDGTLSATGGYVISAGAAADFACVVGVDSTHWFLRPGSGTWTKH